MLDISAETVGHKIDSGKYRSFQMLEQKSVSKMLIRIMLVVLLMTFIGLFLPWTQNIRSKGYVTTLNPDDRPQSVQTLIGGKIENWYVREGQRVAIGDTIIKISEVKEEYLDPDILDRTKSQIDAKDGSAKAYAQKAVNLQQQYAALKESRDIKLKQNEIKREQTVLKIQSDSIDLVAAETQELIAENQLERMESLYELGLKSLTDLEGKRLKIREAQAKVVSLKNKINTSRNELRNITANIIAIDNEFNDKLAKSQSDKMSAISARYDAEATKNKLQSQFNSYEVRQKNYYITSPINGIVTEAISTGLGEIIKNGDDVVTIIPDIYELAVEAYVEPMDMPLLARGQKVRIQFDGWPAIVFSGWPNSSYGTFGGEIFAIDNFIHQKNGKYRVLIAQDPDESPWPRQVRVGGGANTITLLKDVKVGYELWRQLNGFPPDYYEPQELEDIKSKAPLKKVK